MKTTLSLAAVLFSTTFASAQSVQTLPLGLGTTEGSTSRHVPLFHPPARIQCGYDAKATGWNGPVRIHKLTARPEAQSWLNNGFSVQMQVWLSSKGCNPAVSSNDFAANHGPDLRIFMKKKIYNFQKFSTGTGRRPFSIELKGDTSFVAVGNAIVVDWATYAPAYLYNSAFHVDAEMATRSGTNSGRVSYYGTGCNTTSVVARASGLNENELFQTTVYTHVLGEPALMWLSPKRLDLSIGGGCSLYADFGAPGAVVFPTPVVTSGFGAQADFTWGIVPAHLKGMKLSSQAIAFTAQNTLRWSSGLEVTFGDYGPRYVTGHRYDYSDRSRLFDPDKDPARFGWTGTAIVFKVN